MQDFPNFVVMWMQFLPQDPTKVLVTCADSQVRIIEGLNVIGKYKGTYLILFIHFM